MNGCELAAAVVELGVIAEEVLGKITEGGVEYDPEADLCDVIVQAFGSLVLLAFSGLETMTGSSRAPSAARFHCALWRYPP